MARKYKLTWQDGGDHQSGRWRKKYKGKVYYFSAGRGKTDRDAYQAALDAWEKTKSRIDAEIPGPHEAEYVRAIAEWETVLAWCRKHHDDEMTSLAVQKLSKLRKNLAGRKPPPVATDDTFQGRFDEAVRYPTVQEMYRKTAAALINAAGMPSDVVEPSSDSVIDPTQIDYDIDSPDPLNADFRGAVSTNIFGAGAAYR